MILSYLLWVSLAGWCPGSPNPPDKPPFVLPRFGGQDIETFHRQYLEHRRRGRTVHEMSIKLFEGLLKDFGTTDDFPPNVIEIWRGNVELWKEQLEFMKREERELELWEQQRKLNPGEETDRATLARLRKLAKEEADWNKAWEAGRIAPKPREVKP